MFFPAPKINPKWAKDYVVPNAFSPPECDALIAMMGDEKLKEGQVGHAGNVDKVTRSSRVRFIDHFEMPWAFERIWALAQDVNEKAWRFDLTGILDGIQLTRYSESEFYTWHVDNESPASSTRKLSLVVQLSDPNDYEGGALVIDPNLRPSRARGTAILFPPFWRHQVEPVTKGTRYSLVAWFNGPPFR